MADVFTWAPTVDSFSGDTTLRTRTAQFGDGYAQKAADGINNRSTSFSLKFAGDASKLTAIYAFLDARGGATSFLWTPPLREQLLFTCEKYTEPVKDGNVYTMTATFDQSFAL
ncbi:phage tail protein [Paraburkholderia tropica]|uniref:phage tail protein n=1 Tax=Paraburkholderia tropica TaxID=92647 RepID=UPI001F2F802C|nr:phage tail protein [Paraburkholderia tropica]